MEQIAVASHPLQTPHHRRFQRTRLYLPGQIFSASDERVVECKVLNLSPDGAGVQCRTEFPKGASLILCVENFGRFEGRAAPYDNGDLGLQFMIGKSRRNRLIEMLTLFAKGDIVGITRFRRHPRVPTLVAGNIVRADGHLLTCDVLDVSLNGVSLGAQTRPPLGEVVNLGRIYGRVVRHHSDGFAVQYVKVVTEESYQKLHVHGVPDGATRVAQAASC